jgi:hypothetical protein
MDPIVDKPVFCKGCGLFLGHDAHDIDGYVWVPARNGVRSVADVGRYCSDECRDDDPNYRALMDDIAAMQHAQPRVVLCRCGHPPDDHLNRVANCIGGGLGRCGCSHYRAAA